MFLVLGNVPSSPLCAGDNRTRRRHPYPSPFILEYLGISWDKSPCRSGCPWDFPHNKDIGKPFNTQSGWQGSIHGLSKL